MNYDDCKGSPTWFEPEGFAENSPNTAIVQVEKFVGTPPEVTVFKEPKYQG